MKKIVCLFLALACLIPALSGCGKPEVDYASSLSDYVCTMDYRDGFTILQLTDIHWNTGTPVGNGEWGSEAYLTKVIREAQAHAGQIDLIEITGDTFMLTDARSVNAFIDFMEDIGIPYAMTWGNHDREGVYNPNRLSDKFADAPCSLYREVDRDNVHERCNYVINLVDGTGQAVWQLVQLDSGASYREGAGDLFLDYDYIRRDQLDWLLAEHEAVGQDVPVICYYHIPQMDNSKAWEAVSGGEGGYKSDFYKLENFAESSFSFSMEETFLAAHVEAAFMGHAHGVDWTFTTPSGVTFGLGVKTGPELYYLTAEAGPAEVGHPATDETFDLMGASLVTLRDATGDYTLEHLYYNERTDGDFIRWVTYGD